MWKISQWENRNAKALCDGNLFNIWHGVSLVTNKMLTSMFLFSVLWNVIWPECWNAQTGMLVIANTLIFQKLVSFTKWIDGRHLSRSDGTWKKKR